MRVRNQAMKLGSMAVVVIAALALALTGCDSGGDGGGTGAGGDTGGNTGGGDTGGGTTDTVGGGDTGGNVGGDTGGNVGGDTGGNVGGDDVSTVDAGDTGGTTAQENCINGKDDDGDGKADCEDSDCATNPNCQEDCDDGVDNDGDGLIDCDDDFCAATLACDTSPETCGNFYDCLFEQTCNCTIGIDCPDAATANCPQATQEQQQICLETLSIDTQSALSAFQQCLQAFCANVTTDDEFVDCYLNNCTKETVACFYGCVESETQDPVANKKALTTCVGDNCGDVDYNTCMNDTCLNEQIQCAFNGDSGCEQGWFGCYTQCAPGDPGAECRNDCIDSLSVEGAYDLFAWENCRFELCDADDNGEQDSNECAQLAYLFACADVMGSCVSEWPGTDTCAQTTDCLLGCGGFGDTAWECMGTCFEGMSADSVDALGKTWNCAVTACGTTSNALSVDCIQAALGNECAAEADVCGISETPVEICDDTIDNDDDTKVDCDDEDCAEAENCKPADPEICDDTIDNDGDTKIDCDDEDCAEAENCKPVDPEICDDTIDNDGDELIDCADDDCAADPACL